MGLIILNSPKRLVLIGEYKVHIVGTDIKKRIGGIRDHIFLV